MHGVVILNSYSSKAQAQRWKIAFYCSVFIGVVAFLLLLLIVTVIGVTLVELRPSEVEPAAATFTSLTAGLQISNIMQHLQALQDIADQNSDSRSVEYGYNMSADYFSSILEPAGFDVRTQEFPVAVFEDLIPNKATFNATFNSSGLTTQYVQPDEFFVMRYSGSGEFAGLGLDIVKGTGCEVADFANSAFKAALVNIHTGGCDLYDKAFNAKEAKASVILLVIPEQFATIDTSTMQVLDPADPTKFVDIVILGVHSYLGMELMELHTLTAGTLELGVKASTSVTIHGTYNLLASTRTGSDTSIIVAGTHLDSVQAGAGINDNGSGAAMNLEIALLLAELLQQGTVALQNQIIFAFWGAEELGIHGSNHFVSSLGTEGEPEKEDVVVYLNYDTVGSSNYIRKIYNGTTLNPVIRPESTTVQKLFEERFMEKQLPYTFHTMNTGSDYAPFIEPGVDIPAGGIFTDANTLKTEEWRHIFGGIANAECDPCYHQSCDTIENVNQEVLAEMSDAAAYVLQTLMVQEDLREYLKNGPQSLL